MCAVVLAGLTLLGQTGRVLAWDVPVGKAADQATPPTTPTTLLHEAHGYLIQNGITVLNNDGYWFAAQMLRSWQQELLNGVRYADKKDGTQSVDLDVYVGVCPVCYEQKYATLKSWDLAADNHYFNPTTNAGLDTKTLGEAATWAPFIEDLLLPPGTGTNVVVSPALQQHYPSSLVWLDQEYTSAKNAFLGGVGGSIGGRTGTALAMFYLGWASHFMQDLTVVHHTFDEVLRHHTEYEAAANGYRTSPPALGSEHGIYTVPTVQCNTGAAACFGSYAANQVHKPSVLDVIDKNTDYKNSAAIPTAIPLAERLQAGLFAKFLTDVGHPPVNVPAVLAAIGLQLT
jgi:hypothetical protein